MNFDLQSLVRENIRHLKPYNNSRNEKTGNGQVLLDANENGIGSPLTRWYNRYPDPLHADLREKIGTVKNLSAENIFIGNGSDECIDLLMRIFCEPGKDHIIVCPPTFEMYSVYAQVNNVGVRRVPLTSRFQLDLDALEGAVDEHSKMIFLCSPNSPTGNNLLREDMEIVLNNFPGIVVADEAYINFSRQRSFIPELKDYPNLVVLQTFSKAWGLAGLRVGAAMASREIINIFNSVKPPYNVSSVSQELTIKALDNLQDVNTMIMEIVKQREVLALNLGALSPVVQVFPSDANFLLVQFEEGESMHAWLKENGILVSNKSRTPGCENCLRISVGTETENQRLIEAINAYKKD